MKNIRAFIGLPVLVLFIFVLINPCLGLSSNLRLVPVNPEASAGEKREYALLAQGLEGRGSVEVTLHYPPGSSHNVQVAFNDSLQGESGAAQANTSSPGSVRIGIIDANGFSNLSGELAYISFDDLQKSEHSFTISGSAVVTDLDGKKVDSKIVIEKGDNESAEQIEADGSVDSGNPAGTYAPEISTKGQTLNYPQPYRSNNNRSGQAAGQGKEAINTVPAKENPSPEAHKTRNYRSKKNNAHSPNKSIVSGIKDKSRNTLKGKPVEYEIAEDREKSGVYLLIIDLPRGKFNFVLVNGEILNLSEMDKKVNLKIMAENDCALYVFTDTILRIALDKHSRET